MRTLLGSDVDESNVQVTTLTLFDLAIHSERLLLIGPSILLHTFPSDPNIPRSVDPPTHCMQFFNVEWTVFCNGIKMNFSSTSDSYASFPCTTPVASWFSYSTR